MIWYDIIISYTIRCHVVIFVMKENKNGLFVICRLFRVKRIIIMITKSPSPSLPSLFSLSHLLKGVQFFVEGQQQPIFLIDTPTRTWCPLCLQAFSVGLLQLWEARVMAWCSEEVREASPMRYPSSRFPSTHWTLCRIGVLSGVGVVLPKSIIQTFACGPMWSWTKRSELPITCTDKWKTVVD